MAIQFQGNAGVIAEVDEARNVTTYQLVPGYPAAGGFYEASGFTSAVVAAALAANTMLMSARLQGSSTRKAYISRMRVLMEVPTAGAAGGIPSVLGLQRFTAQTPTGGTARTAARVGPTKGSASDMTDIRDSNAALTGTAPTFGDLLASTLVPIAGTSTAPVEWIVDFPAPIELVAGDGVCLRTQQVGPATATWVYSYNLYWAER